MIAIVAAVIAAIGAVAAAWFTGWLAVTAKRELSDARIAAEKAVKLEQSKWAAQLSERFFGSQFREVREVIDVDEKGSAPLQKWIREEDERLTECLNLFELIAYLEESKQITWEDVQAIFCYYLRCLKSHEALRNYLRLPNKSYEKLERLLEKI